MSANIAVKPLTPGPDLDHCLIWQLERQVGHLRPELSDMTHDILLLQHEDQNLPEHELALDKSLLDLSMQIKRLLSEQRGYPLTHEISSGIKLPIIRVSISDGNILNWNTFWQQFNVALHSKTQSKDTKNLAYLRDALKDGPVKHVIEGLAQDGECYKEAIRCLQRRYNWPSLIHQVHVCTIYEALSSRDSNGRELDCLHDIAALCWGITIKAMDYESSDPFITFILKLKLDLTTMSEWQRHRQDSREIPHYTALLEFLDHWTHASKNNISDTNQRCQTAPPEKKLPMKLSYHINNICVAGKLGKHP